MAGKQRYTAEQVAQALRETKGLVTYAARHLGCDPDTVVNYAKRYAVVREAQEDARRSIVDMAEVALCTAIAQGNVQAITFALRTLGRDRGYVERVEQEHSGAITQHHAGAIEVRAIDYRHSIRALAPPRPPRAPARGPSASTPLPPRGAGRRRTTSPRCPPLPRLQEDCATPRRVLDAWDVSLRRAARSGRGRLAADADVGPAPLREGGGPFRSRPVRRAPSSSRHGRGGGRPRHHPGTALTRRRAPHRILR